MPNASTVQAIAELEALSPNGKIDQYAMVKIENLGSEPIVWQYANRPWRIGSINESVNYNIVPWELMVLYCGDPRTHDVPGDMRHRDRAEQWQRLRTNYGVYDDMEMVESNIPKLRVTTISGLEITTVLDDPDGNGGEEFVAAQQAAASQTETIARLEAQLAQVLAVADQQQKVIQGQQSDNKNAMPAGEDHTTTTPVAPEQPNVPTTPAADEAITAEDLAAAFEADDNKPADTDVASNVTPVGDSPKTPKPPATKLPASKPTSKPRTAGTPRKAGS